MCVCVWGVREHLGGVCSLLLSSGFEGFNSGNQAGCQVPVPMSSLTDPNKIGF